VRLIDGNEADLQLAEQALKGWRAEALRGKVKDIQASRGGEPENFAPLVRRLRVFARDRGSPYAPSTQSINLVTHQSKQRAHHQGHSGENESRNLETEAFATAGRHETKDIDPGKDGINSGFLDASKGSVSKNACQRRQGVFAWDACALAWQVNGVKCALRHDSSCYPHHLNLRISSATTKECRASP
jgi:hypothetical protein